MNIEELDIIKELSEQTYFGDLPFSYYADLIGKLLTAYEKEKEKEKSKELEKYDYRKIKFDDKNKIKSPSFTKEQLELMNFGICLYVALPKILADEEDEDEEEI